MAVSRAGFVLVGGKSTRMGRDKALLPWRDRTLVDHIADAVQAAAGSVTLIGDPAKYAHLGYAVAADMVADCGPLGGILTALAASQSDWNLVLACDLPEVDAAFLRTLLARAADIGADALLPAGPSGLPEPLCAVYHRRCLDAIRAAVANGVRKVSDGLASLKIEIWRLPDSAVFHNLNTSEDWHTYSQRRNIIETHGKGK